jgi:hypothetical protein
MAVVAGAGAATEFLDAANALYDALPKRCKPGYYLLKSKTGSFWKRRWRANQAQRLKATRECFGEINFKKAIKNLLLNQVEDFAIGRVGRAAQAAREAANLQSPVGLQAGPWDTAAGKQWTEYQRAEQRKKDDARRAEEIRAKAVSKAQRTQKAVERAIRNRHRADRKAAAAKRDIFYKDLRFLRTLRRAANNEKRRLLTMQRAKRSYWRRGHRGRRK